MWSAGSPSGQGNGFQSILDSSKVFMSNILYLHFLCFSKVTKFFKSSWDLQKNKASNKGFFHYLEKKNP